MVEDKKYLKTVTTVEREIAGKSKGIVQIIFGLLVLIVGILTKNPKFMTISIVFSIILIFLGNYNIKKARHVAWTMEAIERERITKEIKCNRCNMWNPRESVFCKECGFALKLKCVDPNCGSYNDYDAKICNVCGQTIAK